MEAVKSNAAENWSFPEVFKDPYSLWKISVPLSITEYSQKDLFPELDFDMTDTLHPLDVALLYKIVLDCSVPPLTKVNVDVAIL